MIEELKSREEFRDALRRRVSIVITDSTGNRFHANPWSCEHVLEDHFLTKVIQHGGRNGRYYEVTDLAEAQVQWPSVVPCA